MSPLVTSSDFAGKLRIVIPGGTGQLGTLLARHFHEQGHLVSSITRFPKPHEWESVHWDSENLGHWVSALDGADAVINLAGRSLRCRFTRGNRRVILDSRVRTTRLVAEAVRQCVQPPRVWLNASLADIYESSSSQECDDFATVPEQSKKPGFSVDLAKAWEAALCSVPTPGTRKLVLRMTPVMSLDQYRVFDNWLRLVRLGWGGEVGDGEQYVSWIHDVDFIRAVEFLIHREDMHGAVNVAAPGPLPNHEFMCHLRNAWCTSYFGLPMPKWLVVAVGACVGREPEAVLKSVRVIPRRLLEAGFQFRFPQWRGACSNLVDRWRLLNGD